MKDSKHINPVMSGDHVRVGKTVFMVSDSMAGYIIRDSAGVFLAELPPNQIALCAWFHNRE